MNGGALPDRGRTDCVVDAKRDCQMRSAARAWGYALIELVMVIAILGVVSATVTLSITSQTRNYVISDTDKLRRSLSHVQALAAGWGARLRVTSTGSGYSVTCRTALGRSPCNLIGDPVTDPV